MPFSFAQSEGGGTRKGKEKKSFLKFEKKPTCLLCICRPGGTREGPGKGRRGKGDLAQSQCHYEATREGDNGMFCLVLQVSSLLAAKRQKIVMQADGGSSRVSADAFQRTMQLVNVLAHSQLLFCLHFLTYLPAFASSHLHLLVSLAPSISPTPL